MKLLVPERGSAEAASLWGAADGRVSSLLLYAETRAAIGRASRMGRLDVRQAETARLRVEDFWATLTPIDPTVGIVRRAGDLAESQHLRGFDAVHLASYEEIADEHTALVAADGDLLRAARSRGHLTVAAG